MLARYFINKEDLKFTFNDSYTKSFVYDLVDSHNSILIKHCTLFSSDIFDYNVNVIYNNVLHVMRNLGVIYEKNN